MAVATQLNNIFPTTKSIDEKFPNGQIIKSKIKGDLDLLIIPDIAWQAHIFANINHSLLSIGSLCDARFTVTFKFKDVIVVYKEKIILRGWINHQNKF